MSAVLAVHASAARAAAPVIEVLGGGGCAAQRVQRGGEATPASPDALFISKLCAALPAARRVVSLGALPHGLPDQHRARHPAAVWEQIAPTLAGLRSMQTGPAVDLVVCADLGALEAPLQLLAELAEHAAAEAVLIVGIRNAARLSSLEALVEGDLSGPMAAEPGHPLPRVDSPASAYKLLMDAGWMPHLADHTRTAAGSAQVAAAAQAIADALNVPRATAARTLGMDTLIVECRATFTRPAPRPAAEPACFSVVVPTTRELQLRLNVAASPGLQEVDARIVTCRGASSAAETVQQSLAHCDQDWLLLCHQDVYFPRGFGLRLNALLKAIPVERRASTLIGFVGMGVCAQTQSFEPAGFVIDRLHRADHPASASAVSIDELALVVSRDSIHAIDPRLGWHLWATDLCLAAICEHRVFPQIVRLPLFHNSLNDYTLPDAFHASAARLAAKYPSFGPIPTLCGTIDANFLSRHHKAAS